MHRVAIAHGHAAPGKGRWFAVAMLIGLGGCASYHPLPLPQQVQPVTTLGSLQGNPGLAPLDMHAIERLVLLNDPDRKAHV